MVSKLYTIISYKLWSWSLYFGDRYDRWVLASQQKVLGHWRFLAFWLSLCFGNCLLFLICHCTVFLLSTRAMTTLGWLPNAFRDMVILVRPETGDCVNLLSLPNSIQYPSHFLFGVFNSRHDVHSASWRRYVTGIPTIFSCLLSYLGEHSEVSQAWSLHACWARMPYNDRLETIDNSQSTNSAKTLKIFNVYSRLGL